MAGPFKLPALRQDLALHPGPAAGDGAPTWTLHDPAANRFYQLSWPAFELLSRWTLGSMEAVIEAVNRETTLRVTQDDVEGLLRMLMHSHLFTARSAQDTQLLAERARGSHLGPARWLLKNYLFFRLPLVRPMGFLRWAAPFVRWAFQPAFWGGIAVLALLGLGLAAQRWDEFTHTFVSYADWSGALAMAVALSVAKVLHELGHAFTAHRYGCRVPSMGVAFLVMWPVLYTDTNEAWKLTSRRQRLAIGGAGMLTEIALAAVATVAWSLLPDGPLRSGAFLLATTTWLLTVAINASPFMRFDGYFLLSDAMNLPNLHERAFALGRWWLRERLFGWGDDPPEVFAPARQRFLIAFAFATWLYRLVLFLGIALLVYHLFFKALGVLLMAVELGWFIGWPVMREIKAWWQRRDEMRWNRASRRTVFILGAVGLVLLWPWQTTVRAPAVLGALQAQALYAPYAAQSESMLPRPGQVVKAGETLARLKSPDLLSRLALAQAREQQLQWQLAQQPFDSRLMEAGPALRKHWEAAVEEVAGLARELQRLNLTAPFDGTVVEVADDVAPGTWLAAGARLLQVNGPQGIKVDAFVDETSLQDLSGTQSAVFIPHRPEGKRVLCTDIRVDAVQLAQLEQPSVASSFGGAIAAQAMGDGRLVPLQPTFRVRLEGCGLDSPPASEVPGVALLSGERRSWAMRGLRRLAAVWQREASF
jgi:putative peptide zinc metalloprotease protein